MKNTVLSSVIMMLAFAVCAPALAEDKPQDKSQDKPDFPKFEEVTKDMKTIEGFITTYRDDKKDKFYARIPSKTLDKPFLLATSIARGPEYAGWQWVDAAVYWERIDKKLVLMAADPRYTKGKGSTVEDVIARTYTDSIVATVSIVTEIEGDPVIDLGKLLKSDFAQIRDAFPGKIDASLSRIGTIKNFEKNLEVDVNLTVNAPRDNGGSEVGFHYSFHYLPDNGFKSREADTRIGYFLTVMKDWTADHGDRTIFKRYINRWELRKAQSDQEVSDVLPEDQIVFYIEKTVPVKYRRYVREGILEWNKAFEAAGLRNAVAAVQQTETVHNDKDPEDVRYNFVRWIVTGRPFAMGPSRVNPFTGQILDADIIFDDSMIRAVLHEYDISAPKAIDSSVDRTLNEFLSSNADWFAAWHGPSSEQGHSHDQESGSSHDGNTFVHKPSWLPQDQFDPTDHRCEVGIGMVRELSMASFQAAQAGRDLPEEYIGQAIKETVMHEVGHTLGLRHNFKASSWQKLKDGHVAGDLTKPTTGSVMDYNPYTFADAQAQQGSFATPTLGPYDYWAIEYGYREFVKKDGEGNPKDEKEMLRKIASRCSEPGLDYATDEDTSDVFPDPRVNRWDDGREPMDFATDRMNAVDKLWKDGLDWSVKDGASLNKARRTFNTLLNQYGFAARIAARNVGGQYVYRDHKGDPNERAPRVPVPAAEQRAALKFLADTVFSDKSFQFSTTLLNALAPGRWSHWDSDAMDRELTFDVHDRVLMLRMRVLFLLMNPFTINRIYDAQVQGTDDALTVPELFKTVNGTIWSELSADGRVAGDGKFTNRKPFISSYRRALQRGHAQRLIAISLSQPGSTLYADPHAVARMTLKGLGASIQKTLKDKDDRLDDASRAHLEDTNRRIKEALEAEYALR